jgi:signal transduction histidine kinase/ligand-binding sensor domain-containing protein
MNTDRHPLRAVLIRILCLFTALYVFTRPEPTRSMSRLPPTDVLSVLRFERLSQLEGLSHDRVLAILQDTTGFLWIGTADGLNRFDGYTFTIYKHDPNDSTTLSGDTVYTLYETRDGILWVGTNRGLDRFDRTRGTFVHTPFIPDVLTNLSSAGVQALHEDHDGALWIGSLGGGLSRLDRATDTLTHYQHIATDYQTLSDNTVNTIYTDRLGDMWVGTRAGLDRYDASAGAFVHYSPLADIALPDSHAVRAIYEDHQDNFWIGTEGSGLQRLDRNTGTFMRYLHDAGDLPDPNSDIIWTIGADRSGCLWVGTQAGLDYINPMYDQFVHFRYVPGDQSSLSADSVLAVYVDQGGVVWFGTDGGGLSKLGLGANNFALYRHVPGALQSLSENMVWSVVATHDGAVWVGTMYEGLDRLDRQSGTVTHYTHRTDDPGSLSNNDVRALLVDHTGLLWIGTFGGGLDSYNPSTEQFTHYTHDTNDPASLGENHIRVLYEDSRGYLWIGLQSLGLDCLDPTTGIFTHYRSDPEHPSGLSGNRIRAILEDREGRLWLGLANSGITVLNPETGDFVVYRHDSADPSSLGSDSVMGFCESAMGELWVATYGGGLNRFDPVTTTFHRYVEKEGLPDNEVYAILEDAQGLLWLTTNHGLVRFDPLTDSFRTYTANDGLQSNAFNYGAAYRSASGELFFGGPFGLTAFYPERLHDNAHIPNIVITEFRILNRTVFNDLQPNTHLALSYRDTSISFEFAALDYNAPDENRYAYRLEGQDEDWIEAGTRRHTDYTNLKGGDYTFRVKAANDDGVWNETGIAIPIIVTRPFWETWGFRGLAVLCLVSGALTAYKLRTRRVEALRRRLEQQVTARTYDIERRRQVAEGLRDILGMLNADRPLAEVLDYITAQAYRLLNASMAVFHFLDIEAQCLRLESGYGIDTHLMAISHIPLHGTDSVTADTFTRQSCIISDMTIYRTSSPVSNLTLESYWLDILPQHFQACMCLPIFVNEQVYGILSLYYIEPQNFTEEDISLAHSLGDRVSLAIENSRLRQQVEETAVMHERNRIARELHDSVSQALYGIALGTHTARTLLEQQSSEDEVRAALAEPLNYVLSLANVGLTEMRALIFELRPDVLEVEGLVAALTQLVITLRASHQLTVETDFCAEPDMPFKVKEALYRVVQEAMNNTLKHANATRIMLSLHHSVEGLVLEVRDDGVGFEPQNEFPGHFGLKTMYERVTQLGGDFSIMSTPGQGTHVRVSFFG